MATPLQGNIYTKGDKITLAFLLGFNLAAIPTLTGKFVNITNGNITTFNNNDITQTDVPTGTITVPANLAEVGEYMAQFKANNATLAQHSPEFYFKVTNPITTF